MTSIGIRKALDEDLPFVHDSWLEAFRKSRAAGPVPRNLYRRLYREIISAVLAYPGTDILVAYNPEDAEQIYGYVAYRLAADPIVHFAYVKQPFRRHGIASMLLKKAGINPESRFLYTFKTPLAHKIARSSFTGADWRPEAAWDTPKNLNLE